MMPPLDPNRKPPEDAAPMRGAPPPMPGAMPQQGAAPKPPMSPMPSPGAPPPPGGAAPGGAPPQPSAQGAPQDENVARVLWERANKLTPQDIQALGRAFNREAGLIMLKLVPELSPIILEMGQMQGPEMQEIRQQHGHDDFMGQIRGKGQPQQQPQAPQGPPSGGLRSI